jgi:hypothetical protein
MRKKSNLRILVFVPGSQCSAAQHAIANLPLGSPADVSVAEAALVVAFTAASSSQFSRGEPEAEPAPFCCLQGSCLLHAGRETLSRRDLRGQCSAHTRGKSRELC